ncbi:hypothetical protein M8494_09245 [Serratia ureilytica]
MSDAVTGGVRASGAGNDRGRTLPICRPAAFFTTNSLISSAPGFCKMDIADDFSSVSLAFIFKWSRNITTSLVREKVYAPKICARNSFVLIYYYHFGIKK